MYLHSIEGLHTEIKQTDLYQSKGNAMKPVLIDKTNLLINSIVSGNRHIYDIADYQPVPLSKVILQRLLGTTEYLKVIKLLENLDYIEINHNYTASSFIKSYEKKWDRKHQGKAKCKTYSLTDKAIEKGINKVGIISPRMEKKIKKFRFEKFMRYYEEPMHQTIIENLMQVKFSGLKEKAVYHYRNSQTKSHKHIYARKTYHELREISTYNEIEQYAENDIFYYTQSDTVGRVFHYYANIPKEYRETLTLKDNTSLGEIDLTNAQPLIIGLDYLNGKETLTTTDENLKVDLLTGKFYMAVSEQAKKQGDTATHELFTTNYSKFKAQVLGEGLYFNYIPNIEKIKPMEKHLLELYPDFTKYVRSKKRKEGYKSISYTAQQVESSIFIDGIFKDLKAGEFAIPVHDSLIVKADEVNKYKDKLVGVFNNKFPYLDKETIEPLFKITYNETN